MASTTITTSAPSADDRDEVALRAEWEARVQRARGGDTTALPEGVSLGTLRVFGRAGDQPVAFPVLRAIADLELLPPDVQFGLTLANRTITAFGAQGGARMAFASTPGEDAAEQITVLDPTKHVDVLLVGAIAGG